MQGERSFSLADDPGRQAGAIHLRSEEKRTDAGVERPFADAMFYTFVQGAGLADSSGRVFVGALTSIGSDFRLLTNIEGCASDAATCFPRQIRATAGLGGMF